MDDISKYLKKKLKTPWKEIYFLENGLNNEVQRFIKENKFEDYGMSCQNESERWAKLLNMSFPFMTIEIHHGMYNDEGHTWIEIDGFKFDPTASQFDSYPEMQDYLYDVHEIEELDDLSKILEDVVLYHGTSSMLWISEDRESDYLYLTIDKEHAEFHARSKSQDDEAGGEPLIIEVKASLLNNLSFDYDDDLGNNDQYYNNWKECYEQQGTIYVRGSIQSSKFKVVKLKNDEIKVTEVNKKVLNSEMNNINKKKVKP